MTITYSSYDDAEMLKIARAVIKLNKHAAGYTPEQIVANMKRTALELDNPDLGYIGTGGWMVSAYRNDDGTVGIKASVHSCCFSDEPA